MPKTPYAQKNFWPEIGLNTLKETFMLTKIKNTLKKVTVMEWVVLGIAVLALVAALGPKGGNHHKGAHKGDKHSEKASVEAVK